MTLGVGRGEIESPAVSLVRRQAGRQARSPQLMLGPMHRGGASSLVGERSRSAQEASSSESDRLLGSSDAEGTANGSKETMVPVMFAAPSLAQSSKSLRPRSAAALQV